MAGYVDLIKKLEELRSNVAVFRKVVLHMHSPDSYDYDKNAKSDKQTAESDFTTGIKTINYDLVAITDHMKCDFACRLSSFSTSIHTCEPGREPGRSCRN